MTDLDRKLEVANATMPHLIAQVLSAQHNLKNAELAQARLEGRIQLLNEQKAEAAAASTSEA